MAVKLNKSISEIITGFGQELAKGLQAYASDIADLRSQLAIKTVDIARFDEYITYADSFKAAPNPSKPTRISLRKLYDFHRSGRFGKFDIRPVDNRLATLKASKERLPNSYTTCTGIRPQKNDITQWNGGLVLDVDIRKALFSRLKLDADDTQQERYTSALREFRKQLHENLCRHHWYLWTTFSATLGGVHIRTKSDIDVAVQAFDEYLSSEAAGTPTSNDRYTLLYNINALCKYVVCYDELLRAARVFNEAYGLGDDLEWVANAVDASCLKISQGMCVAYDPELEINPNFKDAPLYLDLYDYRLPDDSPFLGIESIRAFLKRANPLCGNTAAAKALRISAAPRIAMTDINPDCDLDIAAFRQAEARYEQSPEGRNALYWRVVTYLYKEFTGENAEATVALCRKLFDPQSHHSHEHEIRAKVQSVAKSDYKVSSSIRSLMTQVLYTHRWQAMIREDERPFELTFDPQNTYELKPDEYVGKYIHEIVGRIVPGQSMILVSGTGTGKTEGVMSLAMDELRIGGNLFSNVRYTGTHAKMLIIEPFKSIVMSKFRKYEPHVHLIYGTHEDDPKSDVCIAIIDKVIKSVDLGTFACPRFDYIVIDESHLLTISEYRQKCGLLLDYLRSQRINSKVIYMTGTPVFERSFLPEDTLCVRLTKAAQHPKRVNIFTQYVRPLTVMRQAIAEEIRRGRKVICVLRSKSHQTGIVRVAEEILRRKVRWDVFYSDAAETPLARNIVERKTLGDTELAFVTSVFSVGVDLEGEENAVMYTYQELNGVAVDQYANRLRRVPIEFNMYGRYLQTDYRPLKSFERDMSKVDDEILLTRLNSGAEHARAARRILEHADMPYIVYDEEIGRYAINQTLYDMHRYYRAWEGWSAQWQVCAEYLRKMGYEVNIDPKREAQAVADPKSNKQINQEKTQRRNERYDRFMKIWNEYRDDLRKLYEDIAQTDYTVQQGPEPLRLGEVQKAKGEDEQIAYARTVYTYDTQALSALLDFMRIAAYCKFSCEECLYATTKSLIDRPHKQISIEKMETQIERLKLLVVQDKYLFNVLDKIELLNNTDTCKTISAKDYDAFVDALVAYYWEYATYKELKDVEAMRSIFGGCLHAYYRITRPVTLGGDYRIYKRYDRSTEELAYHNLHKKRLPSSSKVKIPKQFFDKSKKESKKDDSYMLALISYLEPLR